MARAMDARSSSSAHALSATSAAPAFTVGLEEEVLLVDPCSGAPVARAAEALDRLGDDPRFTAELPAGQLEIRLPPAQSVPEAVVALRAARHDLVEAIAGFARPAAAGVHPCAPPRGPLTDGERYEALRAEYGAVAELQQVCALQVHVAVGDNARTIAVHDALREYLPDLAALAANAPVYAARDTGFASVRPLISRLLPRQGVPPAIGDPQAHAADLAWGAQSGGVRDPTRWWWELRPHPVHGTLELRVPDAQTSLGAVSAVVAFAHALVVTVAEELDTSGPRSAVASWRIEENRWAACRDGLGATVTDVRTGAREAVADRLLGLVDRVRPAAVRLGCAAELTKVGELVASGGGAAAQRREAFAHGIAALPGRLADRYLDEVV